MFPGLPFYDGLEDYKTLHDTHSEAFGTRMIESIPTSTTHDQLATKASAVLGIEVPSSSWVLFCSLSAPARPSGIATGLVKPHRAARSPRMTLTIPSHCRSMRGDSKDARATRLLYCLQSLLANGRIKNTDSL
jgi:hypothetical protein